MSLQLYSQIEIFVNGSKLAEEAQISIERNTNAQVVNTVAKGFAGMAPGAAIMTIRVTNAVPSAGFEMNPGNFMGMSSGGALGVVELTFFAASQTLTTKGFITTDSLSHSVGAESKIEFTAMCEPADWRS